MRCQLYVARCWSWLSVVCVLFPAVVEVVVLLRVMCCCLCDIAVCWLLLRFVPHCRLHIVVCCVLLCFVGCVLFAVCCSSCSYAC